MNASKAVVFVLCMVGWLDVGNAPAATATGECDECN